jgi:hypothetical protein
MPEAQFFYPSLSTVAIDFDVLARCYFEDTACPVIATSTFTV